jgi:hypothetical protein
VTKQHRTNERDRLALVRGLKKRKTEIALARQQQQQSPGVPSCMTTRAAAGRVTSTKQAASPLQLDTVSVFHVGTAERVVGLKRNRGGQGTVYNAETRFGATGLAVAVALKVFKKRDCRDHEAQVLLRSSSAPSVVRLIGGCEHIVLGPCLVMERVPYSLLEVFCAAKEEFLFGSANEDDAHLVSFLNHFAASLHAAVHEVARADISHGDISFGNIMLSGPPPPHYGLIDDVSTLAIRLVDFGQGIVSPSTAPPLVWVNCAFWWEVLVHGFHPQDRPSNPPGC